MEAQWESARGGEYIKNGWGGEMGGVFLPMPASRVAVMLPGVRGGGGVSLCQAADSLVPF